MLIAYDLVIGASLSKPHTSKKLGTVITYTNNYEKSEHVHIFSNSIFAHFISIPVIITGNLNCIKPA